MGLVSDHEDSYASQTDVVRNMANEKSKANSNMDSQGPALLQANSMIFTTSIGWWTIRRAARGYDGFDGCIVASFYGVSLCP